MNAETDEQAILAAIRANDRFVVATHENPDGDALGSLLAAHLALRHLGKDSLMYLAGEVPLPHEYVFMPLEEIKRGKPPPEAAGRVVLALDCANERRLGPDAGLLECARLVLDVDHHHDNTRFGDVNLIVPDASSTGEILHGLLRQLGVPLTREIAQALYIAIVTDTGRFQYSNTTPKALRLAAELVDAGADVGVVFAHVYESVPFPKLKLLGRALESARAYEDGRLVIAVLERRDFADAGAVEPFAEGIIDTVRKAEGAELVALIREPPTMDGPTRRISLRTTAPDIDVSVIARKGGGGGHRQAAGFSSEDPVEEIAEFIHREYVAQASSN